MIMLIASFWPLVQCDETWQAKYKASCWLLETVYDAGEVLPELSHSKQSGGITQNCEKIMTQRREKCACS